MKVTIGILSLQGAFIEHERVLQNLGAVAKQVRMPEDLAGMAGIILPGGESTTQSKLLRMAGLFDLLQEKIRQGMPAWGTCAGAILLAKEVRGKNPPETLAVMDIAADRNAYGSQLDSFESDLEINLERGAAGVSTIPAVFIRAPKLELLASSASSEDTYAAAPQILSSHKNTPVMIRQGHMLATSFHPELSDDATVHRYFISMCS